MVQLGAGKADEPVALFAMNSSPTNTVPLHGHFSIANKDGTGKYLIQIATCSSCWWGLLLANREMSGYMHGWEGTQLLEN